uniref:RNA ligase domain-containing protein n=1 Tax=viral metagenome TaxID=1070528 RepID=A0A6C0JWX1_9ZZZZ
MQVENIGEHNKTPEKYAIYSLFPEDARFSKRYVSTKICVSPKSTYKIYNYDKALLSRLDNIHDKYRSVVFSYPENKLLCFSPPKSIEFSDFVEKYPIKIGEPGSIIATEKIEGISIQLFYDHRVQSWEISTKTNIGGNYWYFMKSYTNIYNNPIPTFYDMFLDALIQPRNTPLNNNPWINELPKSYSYSFVLQHPENPILIPIKSPKLWLVAIYEIRNSSGASCAIHIPSAEYKSWPILMNMVGVIDFPKIVENISGREVQYPSIPSFRLSKGIVLWNEKTGERTLLNNPNYTDLKKLREIAPGMQYEYFCMKRIGRLSEYMQHLPHYKKMVITMGHIYSDFVKTLHARYMDVYVFKKESLNNINRQYKPYLENLHKNVYLPSIRTRYPVKITRQVVQDYIDKMEPREQLFLFSYLRRECDNGVV